MLTADDLKNRLNENITKAPPINEAEVLKIISENIGYALEREQELDPSAKKMVDDVLSSIPTLTELLTYTKIDRSD